MVLDTTCCRRGGLEVSKAGCIGEHHGAEYAELISTVTTTPLSIKYNTVSNGAEIKNVAITTTERCCIVVNSAIVGLSSSAAAAFEIERPAGTIKTQQEARVVSGDIALFHHVAWETLAPGTYTYTLRNRSGGDVYPLATWLKAVASDCMG